jgi:tRNA-2-methylthio-N6-dimethylallyladenosine synthase
MKTERRASGGDMVIAVAGCVAQAEGAEIVKRAKAVDLVFGPQTFHRLPDYLDQHHKTGRPVIETEFPAEEKFAELASRKSIGKQVAAFVTVQEGCDKFCSFCVVPYTRGAEFSRDVAQVISEAQALVDNGVKEITLLGQNVNGYRGRNAEGQTTSLAALIEQLSRIKGLARIRYMTSHPRDMSEDLVVAHSENPKLMPFLHLPVQSGSDRILKAMNRGHTSANYLDIIARVRKARPDIAFSGDFIVGFPGETDADFEATLQIVREVQYASAYTFKYSPRPGTPAAEREDQVPPEVMDDRLQRLQSLIAQQMKGFNQSCVGRTLPVLIEKPGRKPGQMIGRSPYLQSVHLDIDPDAVGMIVNIEITGVSANSLSGQYLSQK